MPPAKRIATAVDNRMITAFQDMSISSMQTRSLPERSSVIDASIVKGLKDLSISSTQTMPGAKHAASAVDSNNNLTKAFHNMTISASQAVSSECSTGVDGSDLTTTFQDLSISSAQTMPHTERSTNVVDTSLVETLQHMSISPAQESPLFMGGLPIYKAPFLGERSLGQQLHSQSIRLSPTTLANNVPVYALSKASDTSYNVMEPSKRVDLEQGLALESKARIKEEIALEASETKAVLCHGLPPTRFMPVATNYRSRDPIKRERGDNVKQGPVTGFDQQIKQGTSTESFKPKYRLHHAPDPAENVLDDHTTAPSLHQKKATGPAPAEKRNLMDIPSELSLKIASHVLDSAAGVSGHISVNPRAKMPSDPSGDFHGHDNPDQEQTKWQARCGLLQTCHKLREEALEVLYKDNTFFARMSQCGELAVCWERRRFRRWLKSMSEVELLRVRNVTFGVEWSTKQDGGRFERRKGDVRVSIFLGTVTVLGSHRIAECPAAPLEQIDIMISKLLEDKVVGEGLNCAEWMAVWDKVEELMTSNWGSPY